MQDAYSLRCAPQVAGAARDTLAHAAQVAAARAGVRDRQPRRHARRPRRVQRQLPRRAGRRTCSTSWRSPPPTSRACPSAGPTASSTSPAATACRRSWPTIPGVDSGLMIAQYTQAALVSELKRLAVPASVDSIPSSRDAGGPRLDGLVRGAQAAHGASTRSRSVLAIELLTAARGIQLRAPLDPRPPPAPSSTPCDIPGPAPTASSRPRSRRPPTSSSPAARAAPPNPSPESCA